jgi:uncharacterized protein (DUF885 family)
MVSDCMYLGPFYVNANNVKMMSKAVVAAFSLHEGIPGHHLHLTAMSELGLPNFLRYPNDVPSEVPSQYPWYSAFLEGWGLYAEYLGYDLGVYDNEPLKEIGYLMTDMLRSARLVVDTGLHKYGWSRETATEYLIKNTGFGEQASQAEIDRYITIPGQAISYKVGEREIQRLRKAITKDLSDDFDIRVFHTYLLKCVGPLDALEDCVRNHYKSPYCSSGVCKNALD